jgi:hypothetical protein
MAEGIPQSLKERVAAKARHRRGYGLTDRRSATVRPTAMPSDVGAHLADHPQRPQHRWMWLGWDQRVHGNPSGHFRAPW